MSVIRKLPALILAFVILFSIAAGCGTPGNANTSDAGTTQTNPDTTQGDTGNTDDPDNTVQALQLGFDLMAGVSASRVSGRQADDIFIAGMADFSLELFKNSVAGDKNSLISPLSVMLALAMTANGARGETLAQMETLLGGGMPIDELNEYLYDYVKNLPSSGKSALNIANSIWMRDDNDRLIVSTDFLQRNADFYNAAAYRALFDGQTLTDINNWVSENTGGLIEEIISEIDPQDMLYLINAVLFDAEWQVVYTEGNIREGDFTDISGTVKQTAFMHSEESLFIEDGMAKGFIKPYADGQYSFVALLPNENVSLDEYINSLSGSGFIDMVGNARTTTVFASMPKFEYEYEIELRNVLSVIGMPAAFDPAEADFYNMAVCEDGNLYISDVLHKTFITVDELGTKAGAVTAVIMRATGAATEFEVVNLNRPFVYAIVDNAANLPVFIGTFTGGAGR